jgi:hypothetical protein
MNAETRPIALVKTDRYDANRGFDIMFDIYKQSKYYNNSNYDRTNPDMIKEIILRLASDASANSCIQLVKVPIYLVPYIIYINEKDGEKIGTIDSTGNTRMLNMPIMDTTEIMALANKINFRKIPDKYTSGFWYNDEMSKSITPISITPISITPISITPISITPISNQSWDDSDMSQPLSPQSSSGDFNIGNKRTWKIHTSLKQQSRVINFTRTSRDSQHLQSKTNIKYIEAPTPVNSPKSSDVFSFV